MCGIAGQVAASGKADQQAVKAAIDAIVHRGPDGRALWSSADGRVCLGHARLAIIDRSTAAAQPMLDERGEVALVFNGEIYNFVELRQQLEALGRRFRTASDSEVLLQSYMEWGKDCLNRLNGMFAFAIWDGRSRQLFAARDRFGEKPFYYHLSRERFLFASEIKALLCDPRTVTAADERAMVRYLSLVWVDGEPTTFFRDILQLPPAHWLTVQDGRVQLGRYWQLGDAGELRGSDQDTIDKFHDLFLDSVRLRLRSDVPVGTGLSGGIDSSAVVGAVRAARGKEDGDQATFSARYTEGTTDEGKFIDAVVVRGGTTAHHVFLRSEEVPVELPMLLWHQDEPFVSLSMYAQFKVMQLAKTAGVTVLLDGQGADEQLAGYHPPSFGGRFASLFQSRQWATLYREMNAYAGRHGQRRRALRFLATSMLPRTTWLRLKARQAGTHSMLRPGLWGRHAESFMVSDPSPFSSPLKTELYRELTSTSLPSLLRFGDRNSMTFSRETRFPFLDHRLVELSLRMPEHLLVHDGITKVVLRRAMRQYLPDLVANRMDKVGFAAPEDLWFRGPLRTWFESILSEAARSELLQAGRVWERWKSFVAGQGTFGPLWRIANLHLWRTRFGV
ncbi:MAG: asparagine synthase (glutamine-hydrolyzing) [Myxococcales bacterium]